MDTVLRSWWFFALGSAAFAALTTVFAKLGVQQISSNLTTAIRTVVILVLAWGIVLARGEQSGLGEISGRALLFVVLSGIATGLSWLCYFRALQLGQTGPVAAVDKFSLVLIILLSALLLGEPLTWKLGLGSALIFAGTLVLIR